MFLSLKSFAQVSETQCGFFIDAGIKYTPVEYLGGPSLGLYYQGRSQKFSAGVRKDFILSVGKTNSTDNSYKLTKYYTYNYLDFFYAVKGDFRLGAGLGWIYDGKTENIKFNSDYGYASGTVAARYKFSWLSAELRADIPLEKRRPEIDQGHLFPVSLAFLYSFSPAKNQ